MRNLEKETDFRSERFREMLARFETCKINTNEKPTALKITPKLDENANEKVLPECDGPIYYGIGEKTVKDFAETTEMREQSKLVGVKILGIHKRKVPKRSFYFVLLATFDDDSTLTLYRKWKGIHDFHEVLIKWLKLKGQNDEAIYYLNKLHRKSSKIHLLSLNGTMRRLRMIETLTQYYHAILYYKESSEAPVVRRFFHPNCDDLNASNWSSSGRTYFCVTNASLNESIVTQDHVTDDICSISDSMGSLECGSQNQNLNSPFKRFSSSTFSVSSFDLASRSSSLDITSPTEPEVYVALEDYVTDDDVIRQNVMSLRKGEMVEVYTKSDTGWWFVKKGKSDADEEYGYVPASYLSQELETLHERTLTNTTYRSDEHNVIRKYLSSPVKAAPEKRPHSLSKYSYASEPSLLNLTSQPIRKSGFLSSAYNLTSQTTHQRDNFMRKPSSDFISIRPYTAQGPDEMTFGENAILKVLKVNSDGWWLASYKDKEGLVPGLYLRRYNDPIRKLSLEILNFSL